jgi:hypothetical protein
VRCLESARSRRDHDALRRGCGIFVSHGHRGIADGWLRGKDKLRENFAVGIKAPGLRFDLVEVLTGANTMCIIYRRENGAMVTDSIELDAAGKAKRVVACYGTAIARP